MKKQEKEKYYKNLEDAMNTLSIISKDKNTSKKLLDEVEALDEELQELLSSDKRQKIPKENYIYYIKLMNKTKELQGFTKYKPIILNLELVYQRLEVNKDLLI